MTDAEKIQALTAQRDALFSALVRLVRHLGWGPLAGSPGSVIAEVAEAIRKTTGGRA